MSGTLILLAVCTVVAIGSLLLVRQSRRLRSAGTVRRETSRQVPTAGPERRSETSG